jgi:Zn finger protein HypA/HybF involved in hydrogenase expression
MNTGTCLNCNKTWDTNYDRFKECPYCGSKDVQEDIEYYKEMFNKINKESEV